MGQLASTSAQSEILDVDTSAAVHIHSTQLDAMMTTDIDPRWWRSPTEPHDWVKCETCETRNAIGVAAVPGVPYSAAFCQECIKAGAAPYWIVVRNTALIGGLDNAADWWKNVVAATLNHLGKSSVDFAADVAADIVEVQRMEMEIEANAGPPCEHPDGWVPLWEGSGSETCKQCGAIR